MEQRKLGTLQIMKKFEDGDVCVCVRSIWVGVAVAVRVAVFVMFVMFVMFALFTLATLMTQQDSPCLQSTT